MGSNSRNSKKPRKTLQTSKKPHITEKKLNCYPPTYNRGYTGYEPQEIEDDYYKILEKVRTEESTVEIAGQENLPILQEPHLYEGAIENTIEMIENSPSNVKFFFTKSQGLDELEGKIKEFLDITNG
ncbi:hypothetical protein AKJ38_01950 [candidate division MSBL1 archaeon SCGC-AAA259I14]|uniref:Uncharacterized protein n=2 Tax=candidate division MSBL1 TaxID=215777 RepID=A0A133USB4_9EURY|nr:hypothetical protein AKJ66_03220 [candidate division MSBL1 archaeon SCGC-AAA259E22]KXA97088.1 hypothetical protein AKJ38_01950 [candidate division MSBL1 archaeon SCGC-AAA259I14]